jgi:hypothetical protein
MREAVTMTMAQSDSFNTQSNQNPRVSLVTHAAATQTRDANMVDIVRSIQTGEWQIPIEKIRTIFNRTLSKSNNLKEAKAAVDTLKKNLPGFIPSGRFSSRKKPTAQKLLEYSGLFCADLDNLGGRLIQIREKLLESPHLFAVFISPTGNGLKAIFTVGADSAEHRVAFCTVKSYVRELCGEEIDESCKDIARLCFVSFDPSAVLNSSVIPLPLREEKRVENNVASKTEDSKFQIRRGICEKLLGPMRWENESEGFGVCPGKNRHTTADGEQDCRIYIAGAPTIHCFHSNCAPIREALNRELRSQIGQAEFRRPNRGVTDEYLGSEAPTDVWPDPKSLPSELPDVPQFSFDCLPNVFRPWIEDIVDRMQCPPDWRDI